MNENVTEQICTNGIDGSGRCSLPHQVLLCKIGSTIDGMSSCADRIEGHQVAEGDRARPIDPKFEFREDGRKHTVNDTSF